MTTHVDLSEVVVHHFHATGELPPETRCLNRGVVSELIDAVPDTETALLDALRTLRIDAREDWRSNAKQ